MPIRLSENRNPLSKADLLITIVGVPGYFSSFSGLNVKAVRPKYGDALAGAEYEAASGTLQFTDFTLMKAFDPEAADDLFLHDYAEKALCGRKAEDITLQPVVRCNGIELRGSRAWYVRKCRLNEFEILSDLNLKSNTDSVEIKLVYSFQGFEFR